VPHRFFIPANWIVPPTVQIHGQTARQIKSVLRLKRGDEIIVLDNSGTEWKVSLTNIGNDSVTARIVEQQPAQGEPALQLTLYQGTLKGQKFEWVLQKGTELGVSRFVPTICQRSVVNEAAALAKKHDRWQRIIQEAAEQSGRGRWPYLEPAMPLAEALQHAASSALSILPWEEEHHLTLKEVLLEGEPDTVALFIGPEGGFTPDEAALARRAGCHIVTLGPRILRAETAGLAACSAIFYQIGEWG
jgi:16S rRNA (uracil1498-N3)-methyltransferase